MQEFQMWISEYRGIGFKIIKSESHFCYYLYIDVDKHNLRKQLWLPRGKYSTPDRVSYDYTSNDLIGDLRLHGGCTFYAKHGGHNGKPRVVEIGCDYNHLYERDTDYHLLEVENDAKDSIDCFWSSLHRIHGKPEAQTESV